MGWLTEAMIGEMERAVYKSGGKMITSNQFFNGIHYAKGEPVELNKNDFFKMFKAKLNQIHELIEEGTIILTERAESMVNQLLNLSLDEFTISAPSEHFLEPFIDKLILRFLFFYTPEILRTIHFLRMDGLSLIQTLIYFSRLSRAGDDPTITKNDDIFERAG